MDPDQFVTFIQMLDAIRCQIGAKGETTDPELHGHSKHLAEEARNNAQYQASKSARVTTEQQRRA